MDTPDGDDIGVQDKSPFRFGNNKGIEAVMRLWQHLPQGVVVGDVARAVAAFGDGLVVV